MFFCINFFDARQLLAKLYGAVMVTDEKECSVAALRQPASAVHVSEKRYHNILVGLLLFCFGLVGARASCLPPPDGITLWLTGNDTTADQVGTSTAVTSGSVGFTQGVVGSAFSLNGINAALVVSNSPVLNFTNELSIECWIWLNNLNNHAFVATKQPSGTAANNIAGNFEFRVSPGGNLEFLHQTDTSGGWAYYASTNNITAQSWHHICLTIRSGGMVRFYSDGMLVGQSPQWGPFGITNSEPLRIGTRKDGYSYLNGKLDEISLYAKELSPEVVLALFKAGNAGKCTAAPPFLFVPPKSQTNTAGSTSFFSVSCGGVPPLTFQWYRASAALIEGANVQGCTSETVTLSNVLSADGGAYWVVVSNTFGSITSSVATLTVLPLGHLIGRVYDAQSGLGLSGATVTTSGGAATTTDGVGGYTISNQLAGTYLVTVARPGYLSATGSIRIQEAQASRLSFDLQQAPPVLACDPPISSSDSFRFDLSGFSDVAGSGIYASTNLTDWEFLTNVPVGVHTYHFLDSQTRDYPQRYYKAGPVRTFGVGLDFKRYLNGGYASPYSVLPAFGPIVPELQVLEQAVTNYMVPRGVKSGVFTLMKDGKLVLRQAYGWRDRQMQDLTHPDDLMRLASVSKVIVGCAVHKLVSEGKLSYNTRVYDYVGLEPYNHQLADSRIKDITVQHCLDHATGLNDHNAASWTIIAGMGLNRPMVPDDYLRWILAQPLLYAPGSSNLYSGMGPLYLGRVVERVTGKRLMDYIQQDMALPFGITSITISHSRALDRPAGEVWYDDNTTLRSLIDYPVNLLVPGTDGGAWIGEAVEAAGSFSASAPDLCRFMQHYWLGGAPRTSLYGYYYRWGFLYYGGAMGTASAVHQDVNLQLDSLSALEFALMVNKAGPLNVAHDEIQTVANQITSWPADGGGEIQWNTSSIDVNESAGQVLLTLVRTGSASLQVKASYTTYAAGSATNRFRPTAGILEFGPDETSKTVSIALIQDPQKHPDEQFTVELVSASGGAWLGQNTCATVRVHDDVWAGMLPQFQAQPNAQCVDEGSTVNISAQASGSEPMRLQWFCNGIALPGQTNATISLTNCQPRDTGRYVLKAENVAGTNFSEGAEVIIVGTSNIIAGGLQAEVFNNVSGWTVGDLLAATNFPDSADTSLLCPQAETPPNLGDNYGIRLSGFILPPITGDYRFFLSSDDQSVLLLSTDAHPTNLRQLAYEPVWEGWRQWTGGFSDRGNPPSNISQPIWLQAGRRYFITALMKEGQGGDHLSVAWQMPNQPVPGNGASPISGAYLASLHLPPVITVHPSDREVLAGEAVTFGIEFMGTRPAQMQWYHNGDAIAGETNRVLNIKTTAVSDLGTYSITAKNSLNTVISRAAQLSFKH